jgi:putative nucleotidyltransferase with HDIG domain
MQREQAFALLTEYVSDQSLVRHCLAVEAAMRAYARKFGEDEEKWGVVGLLHDFDYERWPNPPDHPLKGSEILRERGYPEEVITCILSHADYLADRYPRVGRMEKALYACDEITGLVTATALLRPAGLADLTAASVLKKMKSKGFARGVNRDDVVRGAADFGVDLAEHVQFVIDAMKGVAAELGLQRGEGVEPA